ncbi:MAG TPA: ATP synthase subunit I [Methylomirabilota bacterium]
MTLESSGIALALALPAAWMGGGPAAVGVLAGGGLAVLDFRALAARVAGRGASGSLGLVWLLASGLRLTLVLATCAVLFAMGWAHPVALLVGLTVLPCNLIACGLRGADERN